MSLVTQINGLITRIGTEFKHKASLLISAEFAETGTARDRRRMWRTRQRHKAAPAVGDDDDGGLDCRTIGNGQSGLSEPPAVSPEENT